MITGVHALVYSSKPDAVRAFFRDVLQFEALDIGRGWLIFALPPAELAVHPAEEGARDGSHELYLMCDDVQQTIGDLKQKGIDCAEPTDQGWGLVTAIKLPDGQDLGLYQPKHPSPLKGLGIRD